MVSTTSALAFFVSLACSLSIASAEHRGFVRQESTIPADTTFTLTSSPTTTTEPFSATGTLPLSIFPSISLSLEFQPIPQLIACGPATFNWIYTGPSGELQIFITNQNIPQSYQSTTSSLSSPSSQSTTAAGSLQPRAASNSSSPAVISEIITSTADPTQHSYTWPVVNVPAGVYFLRAFMPSTKLSRLSHPFLVITGTDASCLLTASTASFTPAPSSSSTTVGTLGSRNNVNAGPIAGGIVGAIILLAIGTVIFLHTYRRRRALRARSASARWAGLSSKDFSGAAGNFKSHSGGNSVTNRDAGRLSNPFKDTLAAAPPASVENNSISHNTTDEDGTVTSPSEEKLSIAHTEADVDLGTIAPLSFTPTHIRRTSTSSSNRSHNRYRDSGESPTGPPVARRRSVDYRIPPYGIPSSPAEYVHGAEMIPMGRSGSIGSSIRRGTRKPVPQYNASELQDSHGGGRADGSQQDHDSESFVAKVGDLTKPVHYLIPDMPPASPRR